MLGIEKTTPDEFSVMPSVPLSMPPDYSLRPPGSTNSSSAVAATNRPSSSVLFGENIARTDGMSSSETNLLSMAGAKDADPNIRDTVDHETALLTKTDKTFVDNLLFWKEPPLPGTVINPEEEKERLQEAKTAETSDNNTQTQ